MIQAAWRSYKTRRRVKSLNRAVSTLQRKYRYLSVCLSVHLCNLLWQVDIVCVCTCACQGSNETETTGKGGGTIGKRAEVSGEWRVEVIISSVKIEIPTFM